MKKKRRTKRTRRIYRVETIVEKDFTLVSYHSSRNLDKLLDSISDDKRQTMSITQIEVLK